MSSKVYRFLIVDDNEQDALLLSHLVENDFSKVAKCEHASTRAMALQWLDSRRHQPFDAILLDLNLPESQGVETFRAVRGAVPDTPIIIHSGRDDDRGTRDLLIDEGAEGYIEKSSERKHYLAVFNALYDAAKRSQTTVHMGLDEKQVLEESERRSLALVRQSRRSDPPMSSQHLMSEAFAAFMRTQGSVMKRQVQSAEDLGAIKAQLASLQAQMIDVEDSVQDVEETGRHSALTVSKEMEDLQSEVKSLRSKVKNNSKRLAVIGTSLTALGWVIGESPLAEWILKLLGIH